MNKWKWDKNTAKEKCFKENFKDTSYSKKDLKEFIRIKKEHDPALKRIRIICWTMALTYAGSHFVNKKL